MSLAALVMSVLISGMVCSFMGVGVWWGLVLVAPHRVLRPGPCAVFEYNCIPNDIHLQAPREQAARSGGYVGSEQGGYRSRLGIPRQPLPGPIASHP